MVDGRAVIKGAARPGSAAGGNYFAVLVQDDDEVKEGFAGCRAWTRKKLLDQQGLAVQAAGSGDLAEQGSEGGFPHQFIEPTFAPIGEVFDLFCANAGDISELIGDQRLELGARPVIGNGRVQQDWKERNDDGGEHNRSEQTVSAQKILFAIGRPARNAFMLDPFHHAVP